jgi:hypothetical protein
MDSLKMANYDRLFVFVAEEGERNGMLPFKDKVTVFHEFFRLFRAEFVCDLDFQEFVKEEFNNLKQ